MHIKAPPGRSRWQSRRCWSSEDTVTKHKLDRMIKYQFVGAACYRCAALVEGARRLRCLVGEPTVADPASCPSFTPCTPEQAEDRKP